MLKNTKVGDWVFTIKRGWLKACDIQLDTQYPIKVSGHLSYTLGGKQCLSDEYPSAWPNDPFNNTNPPVEFEKGEEVIAAWDDDPMVIMYGIFTGMVNSCEYMVLNRDSISNFAHARKLTDAERGEN